MNSAITVILWTMAILFICATITMIIVMVDYLMTEVFKENEKDI